MILPGNEELVEIIHKLCDPKTFCAFRLVDRRVAFKGLEYIEAYQQTQLVPAMAMEFHITLKYNTLCGRKHGVVTKINKDGILNSTINYRYGILQGEERIYWSNGVLGRQCFYENDKKHGKCKTWDADASICNKYNYYQDELHGDYKTFYMSMIIEHSSYKHGKKQYYKAWGIDGTLFKDSVFNNDEPS